MTTHISSDEGGKTGDKEDFLYLVLGDCTKSCANDCSKSSLLLLPLQGRSPITSQEQ